jgi:hypothetical protein
MDRIYLNKEERQVLLSMRRGYDYPENMSADTYSYAFVSLRNKGLVTGGVFSGKVKDAVLTDLGSSYLAVNPRLKNPFPWRLLIDVVTIVAAVSATAALFVGCIRLACGV